MSFLQTALAPSCALTRTIKIFRCKLKVDYTPVQCDVDALFAERSYIEILNVCSLDGMVLNLEAVTLQNLTGWGAVLGSLAGNWLEQVVAKVCDNYTG